MHMKTWTHTHTPNIASLALTRLLSETLRAISFTCKLTPTSPQHTHSPASCACVCVCVCVRPCVCARAFMHVCEQCSCSWSVSCSLKLNSETERDRGSGFPHRILQLFSWQNRHEEEPINEAPCSHVFVIPCLAEDRSVLWSDFSSCDKEIRITWGDWAFYINEHWETDHRGRGNVAEMLL